MLTVVAVIVIGGLVGGLDIYHKYQARYHPADYAGPGTGDVTVQVMSGDTAFSLAPRLLQLGVIASTRAFTNAAESATTTTSTSSSGLEAGYYQLHEHMQASLAFAALTQPEERGADHGDDPRGQAGRRGHRDPRGEHQDPAHAVRAGGEAQPRSACRPTRTSAAGRNFPPRSLGKVEGYLFPATYAIAPHETALQILQAMVQRFDVEAQQINIEHAAKSVHLTPAQLIIEASMVQAEAGVVTDMPKIAHVMINRKAKGMPYSFDSVVLYGLGQYGINITNGRPSTAGPYDTRRTPGLPPGRSPTRATRPSRPCCTRRAATACTS